MPSVAPVLPQESGLDIRALSRTFDDTTASYKFLWFLALLDFLPPLDKAPEPIAMRQITLRMLRYADAPIRRYCLSFGEQDGTKKKIIDFLRTVNNVRPFDLSDDELLQNAQEACAEINRFFNRKAPILWLSPFFKGKENLSHEANTRISEISKIAGRYFAEEPPLPYKLIKQKKFLELHPRWLSYFSRNRAAIRSWAMSCWVDYLQARNPNIPNIAAKIARPQRQIQLTNEREWWRRVFGIVGGMHCIYSGERLARDDFALDHFLPWNFVGHNRSWNLIPVFRDARFSKGDNLPHLEKYLPPFVEMQRRALTAYSGNLSRFAQHREIVDAYISDLGISILPPPGFDALSQAYRNDMLPLADLARNRGFACDWQYRRQ